MSQAPTTLPSTTDVRLPTTWWQRLGGVISAPVRGFRSLVDDPLAHPLEPLLVYALVCCAIAGADTYRLLSLASEAPLVVAKRLLDVVLRIGRTDLFVVLAASLVVAGVARAIGKRWLGGALATPYLLVHLALLKALGVFLAAVGLDLWWLPHHAVDSFAVVVGGRVDSVRFVVKCVVAYGPGLAVLGAWFATRKNGSSHVRAYVARAGLSVGVVVVGLGVVAAAVDVGRRADVLRPKQKGDVFPSLGLKRLDDESKSRKRTDLLALAQTPGTKAVVVDFWASWCGPCRRSIPELSKLNQGWESSNPGAVVVVGVNREPSDPASAKKAWAELAPSFRTLVDDKGLGEKLGLNSLPSSYVLDGKGVIRFLHLGYVDPDVVAAEVASLIAESP